LCRTASSGFPDGPFCHRHGFLSDRDRFPSLDRIHDRFEQRDAVHFVAAGDRERLARPRGVRKVLEFGALGAHIRKRHDLR